MVPTAPIRAPYNLPFMAWDPETIDPGVGRTNPWVREAGWARYLQGESISEICDLVKLPTADPKEAHIRAICDALESAVDFSQSIAAKAGTAIRTEAAKEDLKLRAKCPVQASISPVLFESTVEPWKRILCVIARLWHLKVSRSEANLRLPRHWYNPYFFTTPQYNYWNTLWYMATADPKTRSPYHSLLMGIACIHFCVELLRRDEDQYDDDLLDHSISSPTPMDCLLSMLALTTSGWKKPQECCAMLKDILQVSRLMIIGRSCVLAMDRTELLQQWGLGRMAKILDRLQLTSHSMFSNEVGLDLNSATEDNFFGEWVTLHVDNFWFALMASGWKLRCQGPLFFISTTLVSGWSLFGCTLSRIETIVDS